MNTIDIHTVRQSIADLLTEAYAGPPNPSVSWFIDNEPDSGILGLLRSVSAAEASHSVHGSEQEAGSTIAANVEHLRWSLATANAVLRGEGYKGSWNESWNVQNADETQWQALRQALRNEFETLHAAILQQEDMQGDYLTGVLALLPHAAYHLGTIRQMVERVRER